MGLPDQSSGQCDIPIVSYQNDKDERFDNVILVDIDTDYKETAEDCGEYWQLRQWELKHDTVRGREWFCDGEYSVYKKLVDLLSKLNTK